jgi:hypothetical protein
VIAEPLTVAHEAQNIAVHSFNTPGLMHKAIQLLGINRTYCYIAILLYCYAAPWQQIIENACVARSFLS